MTQFSYSQEYAEYVGWVKPNCKGTHGLIIMYA